jgi:hypothetical protein
MIQKSGSGQEAAADLVIRKRKQLLPQPVLSFLGPLVAQKDDDLVAPLQEGVAVAPGRVRRVGELDDLGVSLRMSQSVTGTKGGVRVPDDGWRTYFVFQAAWAALTFCRAVSCVKGGKGGLDSVVMVAATDP